MALKNIQSLDIPQVVFAGWLHCGNVVERQIILEVAAILVHFPPISGEEASWVQNMLSFHCSDCSAFVDAICTLTKIDIILKKSEMCYHHWHVDVEYL